MGLMGYELELVRSLGSSLSNSQGHIGPLCLFSKNSYFLILISFCQISLL